MQGGGLLVGRGEVSPLGTSSAFFGGRQSAVWSFLFVPEKEAKRARRFDAAAADQGFALDPSAATPPGRPTHRLGPVSKEWI